MAKQNQNNKSKSKPTSKANTQTGGKRKDRALVVRVGGPPHHPRPRPPFRRRPRPPPRTTVVCNIM